MKREDFKEITEKHIKTCEEIIKRNGKCIDIQCANCPFNITNSLLLNKKIDCIEYSGMCERNEMNKKLINSAKEFIEISRGFIKKVKDTPNIELYKEQNPFCDVEVGDKVWDIKYLHGAVINVGNSFFRVRFDSLNFSEIKTYNHKGKENGFLAEHYGRTLFWDEIKYEEPKKQINLTEKLRKLEIVPFKKGEENYYIVWDNETNEIYEKKEKYFEIPLFLYFSKESISNFFKNIKYQKISKDEFLHAYKKVFG